MVASRASTLAFVARLPEREILRPRTQDRWSVKDVLAHLLSCDEETVRRLRLIARGRGDRIHWFEDMADADHFNARSVARARRLTLPTVLRRMARVRADLVERLQRLPTAALRDPSHEYTVVQWLPAPGWTHERDHLSEIRAWWRARRTARVGQRPDRRAADISILSRPGRWRSHRAVPGDSSVSSRLNHRKL
ncbi:MAG TPA: DinB family protein [Methylomirabilota bacterium]